MRLSINFLQQNHVVQHSFLYTLCDAAADPETCQHPPPRQKIFPPKFLQWPVSRGLILDGVRDPPWISLYHSTFGCRRYKFGPFPFSSENSWLMTSCLVDMTIRKLLGFRVRNARPFFQWRNNIASCAVFDPSTTGGRF